MNKYIIILLIVIAFSNSLKGQCDVRMYDIYTPKNNSVVTFLMCESSTSTRQYYDSLYAKTYPNAIQIKTYNGYSSTRKFNCHGYAWLRGTEGPDRWIGTGWPNDIVDPEMIYMTDVSYTQVASETYPGKVFWGSGDHSAVTTSQSGIFISKWNEYPLMRHEKNYSPYGSNNLIYYKSSLTYSVLSTLLCGGNTTTVTANYMPPNGSWSCSVGLDIISTSGNSVTVQASPSYNGSAWVGIKQYGELLSKTDIWIGPVIGYIDGPDYVGSLESFCVRYDENSNPENIYWMMTGNGSVYNTYLDCSYFYFYDYGFTNVPYTLSVNIWNPCGGNIQPMQKVVYTSGSKNSSPFAYPNPVDDILIVDIDAFAQQFTSISQRIVSTYYICLYNSNGNIIRRAESKGNNLEFNVSNLLNGIYFLHIYDDINSIHGNQTVVVKH